MSGFDPYGRRRGNIPLGEDVSLGPLSPRRVDPPLAPAHQGYLMTPDILGRRRAAERMGLPPGTQLVQQQNPSPSGLVEIPTTRPLAGLSQQKRGGVVRVDSTQFNVAQPGSAPGFTANTTVVESRSENPDAEIILVTFSYALDRAFNTSVYGFGFDTRVYAQLSWGVGGAQFTASCDWMNGTIIAIPANYVRVVATVPDNSSFAGLGAPVFLLGASLAYGTSPSHSANRARYTVPLTFASALAATATINIPNFAVGMTLQTSNTAADGPIAPFNIRMRDAGSGGTVDVQYTYVSGTNLAGQGTNTFPVPNGAQECVITNNTGITTIKASAVFELAF